MLILMKFETYTSMYTLAEEKVQPLNCTAVKQSSALWTFLGTSQAFIGHITTGRQRWQCLLSLALLVPNVCGRLSYIAVMVTNPRPF